MARTRAKQRPARRLLRNGGEAAMSAATGIVLTAVLVPHAVMEHPRAVYPRTTELLAACFIVLLAYRLYVACVSIDDRGIEVINPFHRTRLKWSEIERFRIGRYGAWTVVAEAVLIDGSSVSLVGLRAALTGRRSRGRIEAAVGELEHLQSVLSR